MSDLIPSLVVLIVVLFSIALLIVTLVRYMRGGYRDQEHQFLTSKLGYKKVVTILLSPPIFGPIVVAYEGYRIATEQFQNTDAVILAIVALYYMALIFAFLRERRRQKPIAREKR